MISGEQMCLNLSLKDNTLMAFINHFSTLQMESWRENHVLEIYCKIFRFKSGLHHVLNLILVLPGFR